MIVIYVAQRDEHHALFEAMAYTCSWSLRMNVSYSLIVSSFFFPICEVQKDRFHLA